MNRVEKINKMKNGVFNREETKPETAIRTFNKFASDVIDYVEEFNLLN